MAGWKEDPCRKVVFLDPESAFADRELKKPRSWSCGCRVANLEEFYKRRRDPGDAWYPFESIRHAANAGRRGPYFEDRFGDIVSTWDGKSVQRFAQVLRESEARIVLISCDRESFGCDALKAMFSYYGVDDLLLDMTVTPAPLFLKALSQRSVEGPAPREYLSRYTQFMGALWEAINEEAGRVVSHRSLGIREYLDRHEELSSYAVVDGRDLSAGLCGNRMIVCAKPFTSRDAARLRAMLKKDVPRPLLPSFCAREELDLFRSTVVSCLYRRWRDPAFSGTLSHH